MKEFNIDKILGRNSSETYTTTNVVGSNDESAPIVEKVSLNDINEEIENQEIEQVTSLFSKYFSFTPEQKEIFKNELFTINSGDDSDGE